jgi:hypothetical protein
MKVTNWRRNLAKTLVATGLISPVAAQAANLDTNLLLNPGFENVDVTVTGDYFAPKILDWTGTGFAYSHDGSMTPGHVVPDYADGADPPNAGHWYFTANNQPGAATGDIRAPDVFYQDLNVAGGATGAKIAIGEGVYNMSAYMSSYLNDPDFGTVFLDFKNAGGMSLGTALINDPDVGPNNVWSKTTGLGLIPVGTATIRASLYGTSAFEGRGGDGYIDNVDVRVNSVDQVFIIAEVNTTNGQVSLKNNTGQPIHLDYYEISSAANSLKSNTWTSLQDQNLAAFPAGNGTGNGWEEAGGVGPGILSESYLTGNSSMASGAPPVSLGQAYNTAVGAHDLVFKYAVVGQVALSADFDGDGDADGADFLIWQRGQGIASGATKAQGDATGDGAVNNLDLVAWKSQFGAAAFGGAGVLQTGFVRYVTGSVAGVPEPSAVVLVGMGIAILAGMARKSGESA